MRTLSDFEKEILTFIVEKLRSEKESPLKGIHGTMIKYYDIQKHLIEGTNMEIKYNINKNEIIVSQFFNESQTKANPFITFLSIEYYFKVIFHLYKFLIYLKKNSWIYFHPRVSTLILDKDEDNNEYHIVDDRMVRKLRTKDVEFLKKWRIENPGEGNIEITSQEFDQSIIKKIIKIFDLNIIVSEELISYVNDGFKTRDEKRHEEQLTLTKKIAWISFLLSIFSISMATFGFFMKNEIKINKEQYYEIIERLDKSQNDLKMYEETTIDRLESNKDTITNLFDENVLIE